MEEMSAWLLALLAIVTITLVTLMFLRGPQEWAVVCAGALIAGVLVTWAFHPWSL